MKTELSDPVALRMPVDVLASLDEVAAILDRKRSWIIVRALRSYLAGEGQYIRDLAAARPKPGDELVDADDLLRELGSDLELFGTARR